MKLLRVWQQGVSNPPKTNSSIKSWYQLFFSLSAFRVQSLRVSETNIVAVIIVTAAAQSLLSFAYYFSRGLTVPQDSIPHLLVARRILDSLTPGFGQLGGSWLPLPYILMVPTIWNDFMYQTGLSGSIVSMISYVLLAVLVYKITRLLTEDTVAGLVSVSVLVIHPRVMYIQSTSSPELLLLLFAATGIYSLIKWSQVGNFKYLAIAALSVLFATMTEYEGWLFLLGMVAALVYICIRKRYDYAKTEAHFIFFMSLAGLGVLLFLFWSALIVDDPLSFIRTGHLIPLLWFGGTGPAFASWTTSAQVYWTAIVDTVGPVVLPLALLGMGYFFVHSRLKPDKFPPFILLVFIPLGVAKTHFSGAEGAAPYGLIMILSAAIFIGYLSSILRQTRLHWLPKAPLLAMVLLGVLVTAQEISLPQLSVRQAEADGPQDRGIASTSEWLRNNYDKGLVLMELSGNEGVVFGSRIPGNRHVYEGNFRIWESALADPVSNDIAWIYMRTTKGKEDQVWQRLHDQPGFLLCYYAAYQDEPHHVIYHRRTC